MDTDVSWNVRRPRVDRMYVVLLLNGRRLNSIECWRKLKSRISGNFPFQILWTSTSRLIRALHLQDAIIRMVLMARTNVKVRGHTISPSLLPPPKNHPHSRQFDFKQPYMNVHIRWPHHAELQQVIKFQLQLINSRNIMNEHTNKMLSSYYLQSKCYTLKHHKFIIKISFG